MTYDSDRRRYHDDYHYPPGRHDSMMYDSHDQEPKGSSSRYERYYNREPRSARNVSAQHPDSFGQRTAHRRRRSWPPSPSVEEELDSLAKEAGKPLSSGDEWGGKVRVRGDIDQEPLMIEVSKPKPQRKQTPIFLGSLPSAQNAADKNQAKRHPRVARIDTDLHEAAFDLARRKPSPYAYSRTPSSTSIQSSSEFTLSPETITKPRSARPPNDSERPPAKSALKPAASAVDLPSRRSAADEAKRRSFHSVSEDSDADGDGHSVNQRTPTRYSFTKADLDKQKAGIATKDFGANEGNKQGNRKGRLALPGQLKDVRRNTDTSATLPRYRAADKPQALGTGPAQTSSDHEQETKRRERGDTLSASENKRRHPINGQTKGAPLTPPHSPRLSATHGSGTTSPTARSRPNSATNSRPSSPVSMNGDAAPTASPRHVQSSIDLSSPAGSQPQERARNPSRLSAAMRADSLPIPRVGVQSSSPSRPPKPAKTNSLPYPEDGGLMPSDTDYQFIHTTDSATPKTPKPGNLNRTPTIGESTPISRTERDRADRDKVDDGEDDMPIRPRLKSRHTMSGIPTVHPSTPMRNPKAEDRFMEEEEMAESVEKPLPSCPRTEPSSEPEEWYTLVGCHNFNVCSSCFTNVFLRTRYARHMTKAAAHHPSAKVKCDFGSPWYRLAWLLILKGKRPNLNLLYALADNATELGAKTCPGSSEAVRSWFSIWDSDVDMTVPSFNICYHCVRNIESLLPGLRGAFSRGPAPTSTYATGEDPSIPRTCEFATSNPHFAAYMDVLIATEDRNSNLSRRSPPSLRALIALIRSMKADRSSSSSSSSSPKPATPKCNRDNMLAGQKWYFHPVLPELTVCEACFGEVVKPVLHTSIGLRFQTKPQRVKESAMGTSCQLYSKRTRETFGTAVREGDFASLAREAVRRKLAEDRLQKRVKDYQREWMDLDDEGRGTPQDRARIERLLKKIGEEWKDYE